MSDKMKEFKLFTIMEYEEEQEYLRNQHKKGWRLTGVVFPGIYTFERCQLEDVVYQLDYNKDGRNHMDEYTQIFQDCGWEYICDYVGYSYFRKSVSEMKQEEEIFNDESSKLDMLQRIFKGRMIPLLIIFALVICPQLYLQFRMPSSYGLGIFISYCFLFLLYVGIFIKTGIKYCELNRMSK